MCCAQRGRLQWKHLHHLPRSLFHKLGMDIKILSSSDQRGNTFEIIWNNCMVCNEISLDIRGRLAFSSGVEVDQCIADTSNLTPVHGRFDAHFRVGRGNRTRAWGKKQPGDVRNGSECERRRPPSTDINISRIEGNERVDGNRWWGTTVALCTLVGIIAGPGILRNKGSIVFQPKRP